MKTFADFQISIPAHAVGETDTTCPQCSPTRKKKHAKCLGVNVTEGTWYCHHCTWTGTLKEGARKADPHWQKPVYRKPEPVVESDLPATVFEWFLSRGIGRDVVIRNRIQRREIYMPQVEDRVATIAFPYYRDAELVNVKYRDAQKNFRMEAGAERVLYGYDDIEDTTIICEGEMDKLSIETAGFRNCVSVPDGAPSPTAKSYASKFTFLDDDRVAAVKNWVIAVDNDAPGTALEAELSRRFGVANCTRVRWPEGCKDANDVLKKHGTAALKSCIESAEPFPLHGVVSVMDLEKELDLLYETGVQRGLSTGWKSLDQYYTVRPGEFTVVTGVPGAGKSNWLDGLLVNLARQHDMSFAIFSPENQPMHNHVSRIIEHFARAPFRDGPTQRMSKEDMHVCRDWAHRHFRFMLPPDESEWTIDYIVKTAEALVKRHGINGIVIDPWNELEHPVHDKQKETDYISVSLKRMRQVARRCNVHLWLVAHPTKLYRNKNGEYPVPSLYDISGSANFRNKADNGIVVWRDLNNTEKKAVEIHVQKIRFREVGQLGGVELKYDPATGGYEEWLRTLPVKGKDRESDDIEDRSHSWVND